MRSESIKFLELINFINLALAHQGYNTPVKLEPWIAKMVKEIENNTGKVSWY